jgi:hypothetical protein
MRQLLLFVTILFFVISCTKKDEVQFILLNEKLGFHVNPDSLNIYKREYDNDNDRDLSINIVKFNITNKSNKKYLFLTKDNFLNQLLSLQIQIFENDSLISTNVKSTVSKYTETDEELTKLINYGEYSDLVYLQNLKVVNQMGFKSSEFETRMSFINQFVVISPNESIVFYSGLNLPYILENSLFNGTSSILVDFKKDKNYEFSLKYKLKEDIEKILPKEILDNLKDNNIEIFKGEIETQRIPIINTFQEQ